MNTRSSLSFLTVKLAVVLAMILFPLLYGGFPTSKVQMNSFDVRTVHTDIRSGSPIAVVEIRHIQNEHFLRDLEIEIKNTARKPIYFLLLSLDLPDITIEGETKYGFSLVYGDIRLAKNEQRAVQQDVSIKPGDTFVFRVPEPIWKGFEHLVSERDVPPAATNNVGLYLQLVSFGDGTGFRYGRHFKEASLSPMPESTTKNAAFSNKAVSFNPALESSPTSLETRMVPVSSSSATAVQGCPGMTPCGKYSLDLSFCDPTRNQCLRKIYLAEPATSNVPCVRIFHRVKPCTYQGLTFDCSDDFAIECFPGCIPINCLEGQQWDDLECRCVNTSSPILIDVLGDGFNLTNASNGVNFDLDNNAISERISWTVTNSDDALLVLDRNGNGVIDDGGELFGNYTQQPPSDTPNGFIALAEFDKQANGGNNDGKINHRDSIFSSLRLWQDRNHNGISEPNELHRMPALGLAALDLDYKESRRRDMHGNWFRYRAKVRDTHGADLGRWAWDVFLLTQ